MSETKKIIEYAGKEEIEKLVENVNAHLAAKINKSQGTENANKVLGIGPDGAVSPIDARGDWNQNDENALDYVKNRTHYEGTTTVNEPLNITWDGNTDGLVSVVGLYYKVSDLVLTDEQIKSCKVCMYDGNGLNNEFDMATEWDSLIKTEDYVVLAGDTGFVIRAAGITLNGMLTVTFPECGIYLASVGDAHVSSLTTTEPVEYTKTVIHKLDERFIPDTIARTQYVDEKIVQSDWNQNDSTQPNYVENRTHWRSDLTDLTVAEGTDVTFTYVEDMGAGYTHKGLSLENGVEYTLTLDGNTSVHTAKVISLNYSTYSLDSSMCYVGNACLIDQSLDLEDTGENYVLATIMWYDGDSIAHYDNNITIITNDTQDTVHTYKLIKKGYEYHTLAKEYLPKDVFLPEITDDDVEYRQNYQLAIIDEQWQKVPPAGVRTSSSGEIFNNYNINTASGYYSHAEGNNTKAKGAYSHTAGVGTIANSPAQYVFGSYNIEDTAETSAPNIQGYMSRDYIHIVGNGTSNSKRSNAHTIDWSGNAEYAGDVKANACGGENPVSLVEVADEVANVKQVFMVTASKTSTASEEGIETAAITPDYTLDKTFEEITAAINAGHLPVLYMSDTGYMLNLFAYDNTLLYFQSCAIGNYQATDIFMVIQNDDYNFYQEQTYSLAPIVTSANEGQILSVVNGVPTWIDFPTATDDEVTTMLNELGLTETE